jgi:hypothetical protein
MNIVCIKKCFNRFKQPFKVGKVYRYDWDDCVEGVSARYFAIYEYDDVAIYPACMGYVDREFLESNFLSVGEFNRENEQVCLMFDFFMDYSHVKLNDNNLKLSNEICI